MKLAKLLLATLFVLLVACGDNPQLNPLGSDAKILAFGDSLTYGTGVNKQESYPSVLAQLLEREVINAGIPGEVSVDGLERLVDVLAETNPDLVILCHGGNDLIRKKSGKQLKDNLDKMVTLIEESGAQVVLIAVPNFNLLLSVPELYIEVAEQHNIPIEEDIIRQLERDPKMKSDAIHPNAIGYRQMAEHVYSLLQQAGAV